MDGDLRPGAFSWWTKELASARNAGRCERCNRAAAAEHHHRHPRRMGGANRRNADMLAAPANALCLCHACHDHAERRNRAAAIAAGLILRSGSTPADSPVRAYMGGRYGWWLLDDEGGYRPAADPHERTEP